jgi:hypothetical protein
MAMAAGMAAAARAAVKAMRWGLFMHPVRMKEGLACGVNLSDGQPFE